MPITTTSGGIKAVNKVILYPNNSSVPKLHNTPIMTTANDSSIALSDRKNSKRIKAESINEPSVNQRISFCSLLAITVRINGNPLRCAPVLVVLSKLLTNSKILSTTSVRPEEAKMALLMRTPINQALVSELYNKPL